MPSLTEEILVTLQGRDNASQVVNSFASNAESTLNGVSSGATGMGDAYSSTFDNIGKGIHTLNSGMISLSSLNRTVMSELGSQKSAMDWVYGTTSKEDTNKVLVGNMTKTQEEYDSLYTTIDKVTDNSLTSMQELIPALNAFRSATQATAGQLETDVTEDMAQFGAFVLAQTGSTQLALTAMMDLSKGIKGRYASLDQYGISAESLKATGLWKEAEGGSKTKNWTGDEKDIKGYMDAVTEVIGSTDELMNTNEGLNAQMGKMWSRAGKRIGHEMMPGLKSLKQMFIDLDQEMNGDLSTGVLRVALAIEEAQQKAYTLNTLYDAFRNLSSIAKGVASYFGIGSASAEANTLSTQANSEAIQNNTNMLLANTDARLANAEAMGLMGESQVASGMAGATGQTTNDAKFLAMDTATDAMMGLGSPYGNDDIGKELYRREQQAKDTAKKLEETSKFEETVANRAKLFGKYKKVKEDTKTRDETYGLSKYLKTTGENTQIADVLRKNKEERKKLSGAIGGTTDENIISDLKSKLTKNRQESLKLAQGQQYSSDIEKSLSGLVGRGVDANLINKSTEAYQKNLIKDIHPPTTFTGLLKGKVDGFGESLQNGLEKGFTGLGDNLRKIKPSNVTGKLDDLLFDYEHDLTQNIEKKKLKAPKLPKIPSLGDVNEKLGTSLEGFSFKGLKDKLTGLRGAKEAVDVADDVEDVMSSGEKIASNAGKAGAVGGEMASATGGLSFMALSEMGLAGAFQALIVPTLAIAGVIAVMIPVIAGLAIEALAFINLVGQVMSAMNFDDIDVESATESLQEIATALAWLGVALGSLTFVGITATFGMVSAGLLQLMGGIPAIVNMIITIGKELEPLSDMDTIDESAVENLQNVGNLLNNMSQVMLSLSGLQLSVGLSTVLDGFGLFSSMFGDAITRAKTDISRAIEAINSINFGSIDASKVEQVKNTMEAIKAFSDAFSGLTKIRTDNAISDFVSWLLDGGMLGNGGKSISQAFELAHQDIVDASKAIQNFTDVSEIDQTTVDRLTKVGDAIKAMGDAFEGLRKIRDDSNWDAMFEEGGLFQAFKGKNDIASALDMAKGTIVNVSKSLKGLDGKLADIPKGVAKKLQKVADTLNSVSTILESLSKLKEASGKKNKNYSKYEKMIRTARKSLIKVSKELKKLGGDKGLADLSGTGIVGRIKRITKTLNNISKSVESLNNIKTQTHKGKDFKGYEKMIKNTRNSLIKISKKLKGLGGDKGLADLSGTGIVGRIRRVTKVLNGISKSVESLKNIKANTTDAGKGFKNYTKVIKNAKIGLQKVSKALKNMKISNIDEGKARKIKRVTSTLFNIAKTLVNLREIDKGMGTSQKGGFKKYTKLIKNAKTGLQKVSKALKGLKISEVDGSKVQQIKKVTKVLKAVNDAMSEMKGIFDEYGGNNQTPSGDGNGGANASLMMVNNGGNEGNGASNIDNYKTSIENSIKGISAVSGILKGLNQDESLNGLKGLKGKINTFKGALKALSSTTKVMQGFPVVAGDVIGYRVARAVTGLKRASAQLKKLGDGDKVDGNIKGVIKNIKSALKSLKTAVQATNVKPASMHVGAKIVSGIGAGMSKLGSTVSSKIQQSTRTGASAGWRMGATIAESLTRGFASALKLTDIVSQQIQQAQTQVNNATNNINATNPTTGASTSQEATQSTSTDTTGAETQGDGTGAGVMFRNTRKMLSKIGTDYGKLNLNRFNNNRRKSLNQMNKKSNMGKDSKHVNIVVGQGAVQVDSRNLTKKESRQVMINALEGLSMIDSINLKQ